ncbi:DUF6404 family protein [Vibrio sp. ZSDE26]|uniref:DUF6404 family protein n=1 Tax=Vibrio amylolyticus TaxID=2847292 RepID=A0A9X1XL43_9VIBR|nr:DUF6404 family protein [Vibrio amylolyticus]MCK6264721.1 DUF6404 family protein [Vibrio amylolyticus]
MSYEFQLKAAHKELESKGVWRANFNPPLLKLFRFISMQIPPPYYQKFTINFIFTSLMFGLIFSILNWFNNTNPVTQILLEGVFSGLFFGLLMSVFYWVRKKQLGLTNWTELV